NLILVGAKAPVGFFAYPGQPSEMTPPECNIVHLASPGDDLLHALEWLSDELPAQTTEVPIVRALERPGLPVGELNPATIATALAALMPENAIICDESVTSGRNLFSFTRNTPQHDYLQLTGGAIGVGLPLAAGAAIACPDRKVICLQADGS